MSTTVRFISMPRSKFPASGQAGSVYFANDTGQIFLCCGGDNYFGLSGLLQPDISLAQEIDASSISGFPITNPFVLPADGVVLQFDLASRSWLQVDGSGFIGPQGPQGVQGPLGPQGVQGVPGPAGQDPFRVVSADYATLSTDVDMLVTATCVITLRTTGITPGKRYTVKFTGTGYVTVAGQTGLVDGEASVALFQNDAVDFVYDGANFSIQ